MGEFLEDYAANGKFHDFGNIVYTVIDFFLKTDNTVMTKISEEVTKLNYGVSSAMAWVYFLCVIIILGIISLIISKRVYYYE